MLPIRTDQVCLEKDENVLIKLFPHAGAGAAADFRFLAGEELVSFYGSTPGTHRGFCKMCGALVLAKFERHSRSAQTAPAPWRSTASALATLDYHPGLRPDAHAFIVDKASWFTVTDDRIPGQNAPHISWLADRTRLRFAPPR